jgi:hypothetical protein
MHLKNWITGLTLLAGLTLTAAAFAEVGSTIKDTPLRDKPFVDAKTLTNLPARTNVEIIERKGGWTRVKAAGKTGWVRMLDVRVGQAQAAGKTSTQDVTALATGRSGSGNIAATSGIRGLSEEELKNAKANPDELKKLDKFIVTDKDAGAYALKNKLQRQSVGYLPTPAE